MQMVRSGVLGLVSILAASGCINGNNDQPPVVGPSTTPTTQIVSVTTAPPSSTLTSRPAPVAAPPTVIVPLRPEGLDALDLTDDDLAEITILLPEVQDVLPHDRTAVTEGLALLSDSELLESTGFYGRSGRRIIDLTEGDLGPRVSMVPELYGSGIALNPANPDQGVQFTRLEERVQTFDLVDLSVIAELRFEYEVNGVCALSASELAVSTSDGDLQVVSAGSLTVVRTVTPLAGNTRMPALTDLSCQGGSVWALVGTSAVVAEINVDDGGVESLADLSELTPAGLAGTDILSGLAFRPATGTWFVTGKRWDVLYELALEP